MDIKDKLLKFLKTNNLPDKVIVVGFSGGQDSLCLLDILKDIPNIKLIAAHLNHNWRGEESKKEQRTCFEYCQNHGIEFYTKTLEDMDKKTELEAREQRYKFFKEACSQHHANILFTAHTKTDNTETLLYRIIKGTGIHGLQGIPEKRKEDTYTIYRPLLGITREETEAYCKEKNLIIAKDSSNEDAKYARNNLRLNIIPKLKEINPNFDNAIKNLCSIAKDYEEAISDMPNLEIINPINFIEIKPPFQRIIIHKFLIENNINYDKYTIERIINFIKENADKPCGKKFSLTKNKWLFVSSSFFELISEKAQKTIKETITIKEFKGETPKTFPPENTLEVLVNLPYEDHQLTIRTRKDGDTIQPFGMNGKMKLKKFFINKAIPEHKRDEILLLAHNQEILWAVGVGISEKLRVTNKPTHILKQEMR